MTGKPHRLGSTMSVLLLCLLIFSVALPTVAAWALEPGDQVSARCKTNPFDKSQMAKAKIYAEPSIYAQVVRESCGEILTVLEIADGWIKVQDRKKKYAGYLSEKDIGKVIPGPKGQAKTSRATQTKNPPETKSAEPALKTTKKPSAKPEAPSISKSDDNPFTMDSPGQMPPTPRPRPESSGREQTPPLKSQKEAAKDSIFSKTPNDPAPDNATASKGVGGSVVATGKAAPSSRKKNDSGEATKTTVSEKGCARLFLKMSQGKLLGQKEQNYLRRHCQ